MRKSILFTTIAALMFAAGWLWAQKPITSKGQPILTSPSASQIAPGYGFTQVSDLRAMPRTISFTANNPGSTIPGGSTATLTWEIDRGMNGRTWTLMVGSGSPSFSGCTTVPVSAISLKCVSASVDGGGQGSAGCNMSNFTPLPNTLPGLPVASGNEGNASGHNFTVVLSYQLIDSWRYIANSCPLNVSYTVIAQ
jgi:hypothetical protein